MNKKAQDEATLATRTQTAMMNHDEPIKLSMQNETNETSRLQVPVALELAERRIPEENPAVRL